jgi:hypothetical protein
MMISKTLGLGLLVAALAVTGCSDKGNTPKAETKKDGGKKDAEHAHGKGPNGGIVFDLGKHHAEFIVDHGKKECTVFILGDDEKTPTLVAAKELTLTTKQTKTDDGKTVVPPMTIKMLPKNEADGKASKFVGTDPGLGNDADFAGTVLGEINGKPSQGEFKEEEHDDHKHEKK